MKVKNNIAGLAAILFAVGISLGGCTKREPPAEPVAEQPKTEPPAQPSVPPTPNEEICFSNFVVWHFGQAACVEPYTKSSNR